MKKLQINLLAHNSERIEFTKISLNEIKKIKRIDDIYLLICYSDKSQSDFWNNEVLNFRKMGILSNSICLSHISGVNYMTKIQYFIKSDYEYSCSMDDDILISSYLWDFIIDNLDILDDKQNLLISPLISNGIPSVDLFIDDFCNDSQRSEIKDIFINTTIPNLWGVNYESLNKKREVWDLDFYNDVKKIEHYYKGIHPVRVSFEAQMTIARQVCESIDILFMKNKYRLESWSFPYFCNSFFFIRTDIWREIIHNESLFKDSFDEVPLNIYMESNKLKMVFIRNGFCLHMAYNTLNYFDSKSQKTIEEFCINSLRNYIS